MCQHVQHVYHGFQIYYKYVWTIYVLFLGFKTTVKKHHPFQWHQVWRCKMAFIWRDFEQCIMKRSSLKWRYYVPAELTGLLYVNTKDLIKIWTISIRVVSLHFVSFLVQVDISGRSTYILYQYIFIHLLLQKCHTVDIIFTPVGYWARI